jgi:hypothetical protein
MGPQDERALDHAYAHTKALRRFFRCEARIRGKPVKAPARKPLSADRLDTILSAVWTAFPDRWNRPTAKQIARVAGCSPNTALEARRVARASGRWPYATH